MAWVKGYKLPKEVYMQTLWFVRTYPRMKEELSAQIGRSHKMDGQPRGTQPGDPTAATAIQCAELSAKIAAVDRALQEIPEEYRSGIFQNVVYRIPYPSYAAPNTWKQYRRRFLFRVARNAGFW